MSTQPDKDQQLLRNFFGGSFNLDWTYDYNTSDEVVEKSMRDAPQEEIDRLMASILKMLECDRDNEEMEKSLFREFGCGSTKSEEM